MFAVRVNAFSNATLRCPIQTTIWSKTVIGSISPAMIIQESDPGFSLGGNTLTVLNASGEDEALYQCGTTPRSDVGCLYVKSKLIMLASQEIK